MTRQLLAAAVLASATAADAAEVDIKLFMYQPSAIEVPTGTTVTWTNRDAIEHSVTPEQPSEGFGSELFTQGQQYSFTFRQPGEYPYYCTRHESMRGVVRVISRQ